MTKHQPLLEKVADRALRRAGRLFDKVEAADRRVDSLYLDVYMTYQNRISMKSNGPRSGLRRYDEKVAEDVFIEELAVMTLKWRIVVGDQAVRALNAATLAMNVAQWIGSSEQKHEVIDLMQRIRPYYTSVYPSAIQTLFDRNPNQAILVEEKVRRWQKERLLGEGKFNLREDIDKNVLKEMLE